MIAKPPNPKTETIYRITITTSHNQVNLVSPARNDEMISLVKSLGYTWHGSWRRIIDSLAGNVEDRAAELGCNLLANGFVVELPNETVFQKTINLSYEFECKQWILVGKGDYEGWFRLWWKRSDKDFWNTAKNFLSDNRYDPETKCLCVPSEHFLEIEDFAQVHGFKFSDKALQLAEFAKKRRKESLTVKIELKQPEKLSDQPNDIDIRDKFLDTPHRDFLVKARSSLYVHQLDAVNKVLPLSIGALFMEMGTGKTRTAIELVCKRQQRISNVIWFCPVSLKETIAHEIKKHTNTPESQIIKFDDKTAIANVPNVLWYIVGIESMSSSDRVVLTVNHILDSSSFVVVDESSYIKGHNSIRTNKISDLSAKAKYRLILTGTPLSQGVVDLYSQMRFLSPDILGYKSFYSFARNHLEYSEEYPGVIVRSHNTNRLANKIQPFVYQVTKEECLELPDKVFDTRYFRMSGEQMRAYEKAKWELLLSLDIDELDSYIIFRLFTALQQIVSGFWNRDEELIEFEHYRLETLIDVVNTIPPDEKVIIWCKYKYSVEAIAQKLDEVSLFYGDLSEKKRNEQLELFRSKNRFFVSTQATGGHGLTLNEAHWVIFYENEFKYANRLQAEDRCHRIGQENKVTYIDIGCSNSIDERIFRSLAKKGNLVQDFKRRIDSVKDKKRLVKSL